MTRVEQQSRSFKRLVSTTYSFAGHSAPSLIQLRPQAILQDSPESAKTLCLKATTIEPPVSG